jgi:hypothetical protein
VVAMGKLVSSLTMVTEEPYSKYPGLFEGLVKVRLSSFSLSLSYSIYLSLSPFLSHHLSVFLCVCMGVLRGDCCLRSSYD